MTKAVAEYRPSPSAIEWWSPNEAFEYLTRSVLKRDNVAVYELEEAVLSEQLSVRCRAFRNIKSNQVAQLLVAESDIKPDFWRGNLKFKLIDGHLHVQPLKSFDPNNEYDYRVSKFRVQTLWPVQRPNKTPQSDVLKQGWKEKYATIVLREDCYPPGGEPPVSEQSGEIVEKVVKAWGLRWPDLDPPSRTTILRTAGRRN